MQRLFIPNWRENNLMTFELKKPLKYREKVVTKEAEKRLEDAEIRAGYEARDPKKKPGKPKSPFTNQFHCMLKPETDEWIKSRRIETGLQYGAVIQELFEAYKDKN